MTDEFQKIRDEQAERIARLDEALEAEREDAIKHWDVYACDCTSERSGLWNIAPKDMTCPRCGVRVRPLRVVPESHADALQAEIDRLRTAAATYFREFDHLIGDEDYPERAALRDALSEGKSHG